MTTPLKDITQNNQIRFNTSMLKSQVYVVIAMCTQLLK